jgi:hypothetical protein
MQGWVEANREESAECLVAMAEAFCPLAALIDELLQKHAQA